MTSHTSEQLAHNPRPELDAIDVFGLTNVGKVRTTNNDQFLIASFHRSIHVHNTSIAGDLGPTETQNRGFSMVVADGVGGLPSAGDEACAAPTSTPLARRAQAAGRRAHPPGRRRTVKARDAHRARRPTPPGR